MASRKSEPVTTDEFAAAIDAVCDAARQGAAVADRLFNHLSSGDIALERERLYDLMNAQRDLQDLFHKVFTLHSQKLDQRELEAKLRAEMSEGNPPKVAG